MLNGKERFLQLFEGQIPEQPVVAPILHSTLPPFFGVSQRDYFTNMETLTEVMFQGAEKFDLDVVQLSLGVSAEMRALGVDMDYPEDGAPCPLARPLAESYAPLEKLASIPMAQQEPFPAFLKAAENLALRLEGQRALMLTLRGPLLLAAQLRGVETILMDCLTDPETLKAALECTAAMVRDQAVACLDAGFDAVLIAEAVCSPNFLPPSLYSDMVQPVHAGLIQALRDAGASRLGWHVCGDITAILDDLIQTGADWLDIDHAVPLDALFARSPESLIFRGNLDPAGVFRQGPPESIAAATQKLLVETAGKKWMMSSGCDIGAGTPESHIAAFCRTARDFTPKKGA